MGLEEGVEGDAALLHESLFELVLGLARGEPGNEREVHARTEDVPHTGEDGNPEVVVLVELVPAIDQAAENLGAGGVLLLGAVEGEGEDVSVLLAQQLGH